MTKFITAIVAVFALFATAPAQAQSRNDGEAAAALAMGIMLGAVLNKMNDRPRHRHHHHFHGGYGRQHFSHQPRMPHGCWDLGNGRMRCIKQRQPHFGGNMLQQPHLGYQHQPQQFRGNHQGPTPYPQVYYPRQGRNCDVDRMGRQFCR